MWKTVNSVYKSANKNIKKISKNLPSISTVSTTIQSIQINSLIPITKAKPESQLQKTMNSIFNNKKPVMPVNKMSLIAQMSYDNSNFDLICDMILSKINIFKYQAKYAKKTLNTLVLLSYLIKNAPSGFVDEFRQEINIFEQHSQLSLENAYITDDKEIQKLKPLLVQIKQRAKYIMALLTDKKKLLKEKEIAMEIKRKIIENGNKENEKMGNRRDISGMILEENLGGSGDKLSNGGKVDSFLEHYVWKYWNRFDEKMENITEKIIQKIDEYLDLQEPESFSIEELEVEDDDKPIKTVSNLEESVKVREQIFLKKRNDFESDVKEENGPVLNTDLV